MPVGKLMLIPGVSGVDVMKLTDEGPLKITLTASRTSIEYPEWMDDLEVVMAANARKFDGLGATARRSLLVIYPGISGKFEIAGPTLARPQSVDELFFVDYWPPTSQSIIDYATVEEPRHGGKFNRDTGATTVIVPFLVD